MYFFGRAKTTFTRLRLRLAGFSLSVSAALAAATAGFAFTIRQSMLRLHRTAEFDWHERYWKG
jgi:hypothetical protein